MNYLISAGVLCACAGPDNQLVDVLQINYTHTKLIVSVSDSMPTQYTMQLLITNQQKSTVCITQTEMTDL